jgi:hypothetical protein
MKSCQSGGDGSNSGGCSDLVANTGTEYYKQQFTGRECLGLFYCDSSEGIWPSFYSRCALGRGCYCRHRALEQHIQATASAE